MGTINTYDAERARQSLSSFYLMLDQCQSVTLPELIKLFMQAPLCCGSLQAKTLLVGLLFHYGRKNMIPWESLQTIAQRVMNISYLMQLSDILENIEDDGNLLIQSDERTQFVQRIQQYLENHYMENIKLNDIALQLSYSSSHISNMITRITGENFKDILLKIRISKAKELLRDSTLKQYEIANRVGFIDARHFAAMFYKATGMTIREYQRGESKESGNGPAAP